MSLLSRLEAIARERAAGADPAHDFLHVRRVAQNARTIARAEGADEQIAVAAALLHELFNYPKGHPESHRSGEVCAEHAAVVLHDEKCEPAFVERVAYAIRVHPFSLGIRGETLEARVLQDADRLDSIGAVGIARCFATCASMGRPLYAPEDPFCAQRDPDDKAWGLDHFFRKLLRIPDHLSTPTGRAMAADRIVFLRAYLEQLRREIAEPRVPGQA